MPRTHETTSTEHQALTPTVRTPIVATLFREKLLMRRFHAGVPVQLSFSWRERCETPRISIF